MLDPPDPVQTPNDSASLELLCAQETRVFDAKIKGGNRKQTDRKGAKHAKHIPTLGKNHSVGGFDKDESSHQSLGPPVWVSQIVTELKIYLDQPIKSEFEAVTRRIDNLATLMNSWGSKVDTSLTAVITKPPALEMAPQQISPSLPASSLLCPPDVQMNVPTGLPDRAEMECMMWESRAHSANVTNRIQGCDKNMVFNIPVSNRFSTLDSVD